MKSDILQKIGIYEKGPVGRLKGLFHKYSTLLDNVFSLPELGKQELFYIDENGCAYHLGHKLEGVQKILALIAIGKQKKTPQNTFSHEKKLNQHQVIRKDSMSVAAYNQRFEDHGIKPIPSSHSGWNHLIALSEGLKSVTELETDDRELRVILAGIIMTYLSLQGFPLWLVIDEAKTDWDDLILEMFNDFDPEKFVHDAQESGYGSLVNEICDNVIFTNTHALIERVSTEAAETLCKRERECLMEGAQDMDKIRRESLVTSLILTNLKNN